VQALAGGIVCRLVWVIRWFFHKYL